MKSKLTPELIERLCTLIKEGHFAKHACAGVGISERALYDWLGKAENEDTQGIEPYDPATGTGSLYVHLLQSIKKAEFEFVDVGYKAIRANAAERKSWEAWFRHFESRFPALFKREITVYHDDEMAERRYKELLNALRTPEIKVSEPPLELTEQTAK